MQGLLDSLKAFVAAHQKLLVAFATAVYLFIVKSDVNGAVLVVLTYLGAQGLVEAGREYGIAVAGKRTAAARSAKTTARRPRARR